MKNAPFHNKTLLFFVSISKTGARLAVSASKHPITVICNQLPLLPDYNYKIDTAPHISHFDLTHDMQNVLHVYVFYLGNGHHIGTALWMFLVVIGCPSVVSARWLSPRSYCLLPLFFRRWTDQTFLATRPVQREIFYDQVADTATGMLKTMHTSSFGRFVAAGLCTGHDAVFDEEIARLKLGT